MLEKIYDDWFKDLKMPPFDDMINFANESEKLLGIIALKLNKTLSFTFNPVDERLMDEFLKYSYEYAMDENHTYDMKVYYSKRLIKHACLNSIKSCIDRLYIMNSDILNYLSQSSSEDVRLYCSYIMDDYSRFLSDESFRIRKVATIRSNFDYLWKNKFTDEEKEVIDVISESMTYGAIRSFDCFLECSGDEMYAIFDGTIFKNGKTGFIKIDKDVFNGIKDRKVIACFIAKYTIFNISNTIGKSSKFRTTLDKQMY